MPALSPTMTEGTIVSWLKAEGDQIKSGDLLAEIETDKATMELEAVDEGVLGKILYKEGSEGVAVNEPIALLLEEGEEPSTIENVNMGTEQVSTSEGNPSNDVDLEVPGEAPAEAGDAGVLVPVQPRVRVGAAAARPRGHDGGGPEWHRGNALRSGLPRG